MAECGYPNLDLMILLVEAFGVLVIIVLWETIWFERRSWKRSNAPLTEEEVRWFNAQVERLKKECEHKTRAQEASWEMRASGCEPDGKK